MAKKQLQTVIEMQDKFSKQLELFSEDLHKATDELKNFAKENEKSSGSSGKLTDSLLNLSNVAKTAGIAYLGKKIFELGNFAVGAASKMDELGNVTSQVFGNSKREVEDWAKTIDDKIGRSIYQLQNFASIYGSMFKGAGFDTSYFKNISKDLAVFTADFSSFFNVTDDEAFTAIKGALTGETEALKRFGIILNDTVMAEYALTQGIKANWSELDTALKMQLRYNKLMEITTHIQGDAERTVDGYANSLKKAEGLIDNIATSVGQKLIPGATRAVHMFNGIAEAIDNMLSKKDVTDYVFDFVKEKQSIDELKERYIELSELYLQGLNTPESEKERLELYNQILALYPELFGKIDSEAEHYLQLAGALDTVIAKLKEKTLAQFQSDRIAEHSRSLEKHATQIAKYEMESDEEIARIASKNGGFNPNTKFGKAQYQAIHDLHEESAKGDEKAAEKLAQRLRGLTSAERAATIEFARHEVIRNQKIDGYIGDIQKLNDEFNKTMKYQTAQLETVLNVSSETSYAKARHYSKYAQELDVERGKIPKTAVKDEASEKAAKEIEELKAKWDTLASKDLKGKQEIYKRLVALGEKNTAKYANEINALEKELEKKPKKEKVSREERYTYQNYKKDLQNQKIFNDIVGTKELEQLKSKISTIQSYMRGAIEKGNKELLNRLQQDFKETTFEINNIKVGEILDKYTKESEKNSEIKDTAVKDKADLKNIIQTIEELEKLENEQVASKIEELEKDKDFLNKKIRQEEEEIRKKQEYNDKLNATINALNTAANGFSQLASATGSKTIGGFANILGSAASIGSAMKDWGGLSSITGMFSASGSVSAGMASLGAAAGIAAAGIGIAATVGSIIGSSGKKKKAKIDAQNKENEETYKKQISALQQLTQAIEKYSERIRTFADRVLVDISKNPTLKYIAGGQRNFDLMHDSMVSGKHFADITALEKGSKKYRSGFRKKRKDTYTKVDISEAELLKYLGFDKTELDAFTDAEMKQLDKVLDKVNHEALRRATGRNLTESSIEEWKKQVHEFAKQLEFLEKEKADLFLGSTLESFAGMEFRTEKELIKEYTEQFKELGLEGEKYTETIKEMAKNNQVLVTSMLDVRNNAIDGFVNGNGGFLTASKSYFEKIYKNASSVAYDVAFSDIDSYMSEMFKTISDKLVDVKKSGKLDFSNLLSEFDFTKFKNLELSEKEAKKSLDAIKRQMLDSGVDLSLINKLLPQSDFNNRLNDLTTSLSAAMSAALGSHKYESFTETLGKSLYDSTKNGLVKAFSESALYQGMIEKFIDTEDLRSKLEKAGSFQEAFNLTENIMKKFGYEMEANGFGGFDDISNLVKEENKLGNAYYQDKASNVEISVVNNFYREVYGLEDLQGIITDQTQKAIELWQNRPRGDK